MNATGFALLEFHPELNQLSKGKALRDGLSVVVQVGETLWVTNDETISLERLTRQDSKGEGAPHYGGHTQFVLSDFLRLPVPPPPDLENSKDIEEADVEGLDYADGYLWLVGSHSLKRRQPDKDNTVEKNIKRLAKVSSDGNRFLLARIPLEEKTHALVREVKRGGKKYTAAQLRGNHKGNDLTAELAADDHLQAFLSVPGKDNGFDIEGLAVVGPRLLVGLRGPVLRGWAVILELELEEVDAATLKLKRIGPDKRRYRKHFLRLDGLGIRDLCVRGEDLLILAGPTIDLDGPVTVFQWSGGARPKEESLIFGNALPPVLQVPFGQGKDKGKDHAEGMTLFSPDGGAARAVLIVYDSAAEDRHKVENTVTADVFALPE